jgi:hypothetical protein
MMISPGDSNFKYSLTLYCAFVFMGDAGEKLKN